MSSRYNCVRAFQKCCHVDLDIQHNLFLLSFFCILWRYKRIFILKSLNISLEEEMEQMIAKIIFSTDYQIYTHSSLI